MVKNGRWMLVLFSVPRLAAWTLRSSHCRQPSRLLSSTADEPRLRRPAKFVADPFDYHQLVEIDIESLTNRGWGIGRVGDDKWVVMVPGVIPGERVQVRIFRNFRNYSEADLVEVVAPHADRIVPKCPLAEDCGGCQYQHMSIERQRAIKTAHVEDGLRQFGLFGQVQVQPCLGTDEVFGYRSKLTPHYQSPHGSSGQRHKRSTTPREAKPIQEIGFQRQTSRAIVNVESCPIATPPVNAAYQRLRAELLSTPTFKPKGATLLLRQANLDSDEVETNHREPMTTKVGGLSFTYLAGNFFQNNYHVLPIMVEAVVEAAAGDGRTHLIDCYCGSGLFAVSAAHRFTQVYGIEINESAVREATANAVANGVDNCHFMAASADAIFANLSAEQCPPSLTTVIVDPPRKGCSDEFLVQLYCFGPARVVYLSCDPMTQARDAQSMVEAGYRPVWCQPFDLFPQTRHIENLMVFEKGGGGGPVEEQ